MTSTGDQGSVAVELWAARIPWLARFAEHHWLLICRPSMTDRWEVWQDPDQGGDSWGHLHRNLLLPTQGVGSGPGRMLHCWTGGAATPIAERIEMSPNVYPWRSRYRAFPGPNSNTFVQWILLNDYAIGWRGIGRRFCRRGPPPSRAGS